MKEDRRAGMYRHKKCPPSYNFYAYNSSLYVYYNVGKFFLLAVGKFKQAYKQHKLIKLEEKKKNEYMWYQTIKNPKDGQEQDILLKMIINLSVSLRSIYGYFLHYFTVYISHRFTLKNHNST